MSRFTSRMLIAGCFLGGVCAQIHAATPLPFGQVVTGTISDVAQSNTYTFNANANDVVNFTLVSTSGSLSPKINLYSPMGVDVAYNYNGNPFGCSGGSGLEMNNVTLSAAGTYTVVIADCSDTNTGNYSIFVQQTNSPVGASALPLVQVVSGTISSIAQTNSYTFNAAANDVFNFILIATSGKLSPKINLYNPAGKDIAYNYDGNPFGCSGGSSLEMNNVSVPVSGVYTVFIADCGDTNTGNYVLFTQPTQNPPDAVNLGLGGQPQTGSITSIAQVNSYTFGATAKDVVNFTLIATTEKLSPKINLYSPTGTIVAYNYDGNPFGCSGGSNLEMNNVSLPATGAYTVLVNDCSDTNTGAYSISALCFGVCTGPAPPPSTCNYALAPTSQVFPSGASTGEIGVLTTSGCTWKATTSSSFLSVTSGASGTGSGVVLFSATANGNAASRTGTLTIAGQTVTVTQSGTSPYLLLNPSSVSVQWTQGSPLPAPIPVSIYTASSSIAYKTSISLLAASWLSVSPASGNAPGTMLVSINPQSLTAGGPYTGTVAVSSNEAVPPTQTFTITLNISLPGNPALSVNTKSLNYSFAQGAQQIQEQRILIGNSGGGTLNYQASTSTSSGGNWLSVTQDGAGATLTTPDPLTITVNPVGLAAGTYTGSITLSAGPSSANTTITIPVTVTVSSVQQTILLSQTGLTFTAVQNGGLVPSQTFGVLNSGAGVMQWSVTSSVTDTGNWLSATPASGSTDASSLTVPLVTVSVNPANLSPGQYSGQIQVTSTTANNTPQFVSVILNVLPAGSNPGPLVLPSGLIFTQAAGDSAAPSQTISVSNLTGTQLTFNTGTLTSDGANWFSVTPSSGTVTPSQPSTLTVNVSSTGLTPAIRQGVLTILFQDGSVRTVNVLFLLAAGGVTSARTGPARPIAEGSSPSCAPTKLLPLLTSLGSQFTVPAAWPNTLQAQVVDDCGNPQLSGTVVASFSNGDPPVPLISLKNGTWTGTWQVTNSNVSNISVTVDADNASLGISGSISVSGSLQNSVNAPVIAAGGVLNAASYSLSAPLAPGAMISIFGSNLANGTTPVNSFPLPNQVSGTQVIIGGELAPLLYAGGGQLNAIVPFGLPVNTNTQVIVQQGNAYTAPLAITLAPANPAIFTVSGSGTGQGIIIRPDGNIAQPGTPASAGDELVIYAAGLGPTNPQATAGAAATSTPLLYAEGTATLTIGGQTARVDFAGLAPGFAGLYQINAAVPSGVHGTALPVVLSVGGQPGPAVTMAVQ